jgi:hypothetical protein
MLVAAGGGGGGEVTSHIRTDPPSFKVSLGRVEFEHKKFETIMKPH